MTAEDLCFDTNFSVFSSIQSLSTSKRKLNVDQQKAEKAHGAL